MNQWDGDLGLLATPLLENLKDCRDPYLAPSGSQFCMKSITSDTLLDGPIAIPFGNARFNRRSTFSRIGAACRFFRLYAGSVCAKYFLTVLRLQLRLLVKPM